MLRLTLVVHLWTADNASLKAALIDAGQTHLEEQCM